MIAAHVSGEHIESIVEFAWAFPGSGVEAIVRGEIREVHHNPEGVTLWLANPFGSGDKTGFTIDATAKINSLDRLS